MEAEPIDYHAVRERFTAWLYQRVSREHAKKMISYLDRYVDGKVDINAILSLLNVERGKRHLRMALRNLFNFCEETGILDFNSLMIYRKLVKIPKGGIDTYRPPTEKVLRDYLRIDMEKYRILYELLCYSGIRVREAIYMLRSYDEDSLIKYKNFAKYPLNYLRRTKNVYFVYMPLKFAEKLERLDVTISGVESYFKRRKIRLKYLRKWHYNFLFRRGVPADVVDFIQGRSPINVGAMHYLAREASADEWYSKVTDELYGLFSHPRGKPLLRSARFLEGSKLFLGDDTN